jgi:ribonucleoside-diphosphate reductase alpha chain
MDNTRLVETNDILKDKLAESGLYNDDIMNEIAAHGTLAHMEGIPGEIKSVFVCAHDVSPIWHVRMQAAFQKHTDNAVSKTVNFPQDARREDVAEVYRLAYTLDCKGITIYRDGSRNEQVLNIGGVKESAAEVPCPVCEAPQHIVPRPRPDVTMGFTEKVKIGCGNLYITVNYDENGICEVFTNTGRAGGCPSQSEATARLVSVALRSGMDMGVIIQQLKGIRCPSTIRQQGLGVTSCPDAIAKAIEKVMKATGDYAFPVPTCFAAPISPAKEGDGKRAKFCPECGSRLEHEGGCVTCRDCGYSKCG